VTTVVDSNVLIALWDVDDALNREAQAALDFRETGIGVDWELSERVWMRAGRAFGVYAARGQWETAAGAGGFFDRRIRRTKRLPATHV
jgi:hypothetical protein